MSNKNFTHLHLHSQYSVLDSIIKIDDLIVRLKELEMSGCALTDHGNLHGSIEFYRKMKAAGLKPILGVEAYITTDEDGVENIDRSRDNLHLVLLAMNETGWQNIIWLVTNSNKNNFYYAPRISWTQLAARSEGIIATTACLGGIIAKTSKYTVNKKEDNQRGKLTFLGAELDPQTKTFSDPHGVALMRLNKARDIFGDRLYLELQSNNHMWEQKAYNTWAVYTARAEDIPLVITADVHYLRESDYNTKILVGAQKWKTPLDEFTKDQARFGNEFYLKSTEQMWRAAVSFTAEDAFENTMKINNMCNVEIKLGEYEIPLFDITEEEDYKEFKVWQELNT